MSGERRRSAFAQLHVEVRTLPPGEWTAEQSVGAGPEHVGLLVLEGVISRELLVEDTVSTELLGPGDVLRPWALRQTDLLLPHTIRWSALTRARVATLDQRFTATLGSWPEINAVLIDRLNMRAQRLATTQAISQLNGVDRRVLALLWHLAERWGRMAADGVAVPLPLSHRALGQLVGARRPSVSTAIGKLLKGAELRRRDDGTWLLTGEPVGLPAPDTERVVPIRRRLLGRERHGAEPGNGRARRRHGISRVARGAAGHDGARPQRLAGADRRAARGLRGVAATGARARPAARGRAGSEQADLSVARGAR